MPMPNTTTASAGQDEGGNADRVAEVEAAFDDGRLYLIVDNERHVGHQSFIGRNHRWDVLGVLVHVISRPAGGEIRGYVRVDGRLHLRVPCTPRNWPELDAAVAKRLGCEVAS